MVRLSIGLRIAVVALLLGAGVLACRPPQGWGRVRILESRLGPASWTVLADDQGQGLEVMVDGAVRQARCQRTSRGQRCWVSAVREGFHRLAVQVGGRGVARRTALSPPPEPAELVLYSVLLDRFADGEPGNNVRARPGVPGAPHGGDLRGLGTRLGYLKRLGVNAVLLSPIWEHVRTGRDPEGLPRWIGRVPRDPLRLAPAFGQRQDLMRLLSRARRRGIRVLLDLPRGSMSMERYFAVVRTWLSRTLADGLRLGPVPAGRERAWARHAAVLCEDFLPLVLIHHASGGRGAKAPAAGGARERPQIRPRQVERRQVERRQTERRQTERRQTERRQTERRQADRRQTERRQTERGQTERRQTERRQAERWQAERAALAERRQALRAALAELPAAARILERDTGPAWMRWLGCAGGEEHAVKDAEARAGARESTTSTAQAAPLGRASGRADSARRLSSHRHPVLARRCRAVSKVGGRGDSDSDSAAAAVQRRAVRLGLAELALTGHLLTADIPVVYYADGWSEPPAVQRHPTLRWPAARRHRRARRIRRLLALRRAVPALRRGSQRVRSDGPTLVIARRRGRCRAILVLHRGAAPRRLTLELAKLGWPEPAGQGADAAVELVDRLSGRGYTAEGPQRRLTLDIEPRSAVVLVPTERGACSG